MYLRMLQIPGLFQALEYFPLALFAGLAAGLAFAARYHQARPRERYDPETRRRYAELLLDSAAPASGFSTCLSADAAALGRRLKQAISPKKVWRGDWIVGISAGLLMLAAANLSIRLY